MTKTIKKQYKIEPDANLKGANLDGANLKSANLKSAKVDQKTYKYLNDNYQHLDLSTLKIV